MRLLQLMALAFAPLVSGLATFTYPGDGFDQITDTPIELSFQPTSPWTAWKMAGRACTVDLARIYACGYTYNWFGTTYCGRQVLLPRGEVYSAYFWGQGTHLIQKTIPSSDAPYYSGWVCPSRGMKLTMVCDSTNSYDLIYTGGIACQGF